MTSIRDLAVELRVPMPDVASALMALGVTKSARTKLTAKEVEYVRIRLRSMPPRPPESDSDV